MAGTAVLCFSVSSVAAPAAQSKEQQQAQPSGGRQSRDSGEPARCRNRQARSGKRERHVVLGHRVQVRPGRDGRWRRRNGPGCSDHHRLELCSPRRRVASDAGRCFAASAQCHTDTPHWAQEPRACGIIWTRAKWEMLYNPPPIRATRKLFLPEWSRAPVRVNVLNASGPEMLSVLEQE
jgi:hypothetical protein